MIDHITYRDVRIVIGPDQAGERMWRAFPAGDVVLTGTVQGAEADTLQLAIVEAQTVIDDWLEEKAPET